ncbi:MAG TPA: hypothetical protein VEW03_00895 [Longimicrobiaceae bacterium]|nr:hypothetical protein [Longimicrobiaceae bacterium]
MKPLHLSRAAVAAALLAASASAASAQATLAQRPGRPGAPAFEVVGRGAVRTRTTDLAVFRGLDGRDYVYTGTFGACEGCAGNRMYVWDVTDPEHPVLTDSVMVDARAVNDVEVNAARTLAVLTREGAESRRNGIVLLDLAVPAHPKVMGEFWETLTGGAHNVAIDGNYAYVVDQGSAELSIVDLSDPADPREVGRWGVPYQPDRYLHDVAVKDGLAYLAYWDDGLVILDVGNGMKEGTPRRPRLVAQHRYRTEWRSNRYGNTAYAFPYTNRAGRRYVFVADHILPMGATLGRRFDSGGYVHVLDLSNPQVPMEVAAYDVPDAGVHSFWIENDTMYVGAWSGGLRAVDVSGDLRGNLRNREIAALPTADEHSAVRGFPFAWAARPHNGMVFVTDFNSGLWVTRLVPAPPRAPGLD